MAKTKAPTMAVTGIKLVETYERLVFALIARTIQDPSRAEDLAQDVFLRIHRGLPYFRGEARLSTWIYRIVANVCVQDHARPAVALAFDPVIVDPSVPDRQFGDLELRDRLEKAIARLPANYRLLVAAHLATCPNCAAALASARRLERMLQARPVQQAPPQFTARTMATLRRRRWRSEQFLDVGFNIALGIVALVVGAGIWMFVHRSGL